MTEVINIQRVDARGGTSAILTELRDKLSPRGDVVSPRGKALTEEVFGEPLSPLEVVQRICAGCSGRWHRFIIAVYGCTG